MQWQIMILHAPITCLYNTAFLQQIQLETTSQAQNQEQSRARPSRCQLSVGQEDFFESAFK